MDRIVLLLIRYVGVSVAVTGANGGIGYATCKAFLGTNRRSFYPKENIAWF